MKPVLLELGREMAKNSTIQTWLSKHSKKLSFLRHRLDKKKFTGLPLTILVLSFIYILALFLGIVEDFLSSDQIVHADSNLAHLIPYFRSPALTSFFSGLTIMADAATAIGVTLLVSVLWWAWGKRHLIPGLWVSIVSAGGLNFIGKHLFVRPRPDVAIVLEDSYSFPSGHSTLVVALYGFLAYALWKNTKKWSAKLLVLALTLGIIVSVGLSRLYLGVHYLSDVWSGFLLGALCLLMGISITEYLEHRYPQENQKSKHRIFITALVVTSALGIYAVMGWIGQEPPLPITPTAIQTVAPRDLVNSFKITLPSSTETLYGSEDQPISLIFIANGSAITQTLGDLGWEQVQARDSSALRLSFWNSQTPDLVFTKENATLEIWRTNIQTETASVFVATAWTYSGYKWNLIPEKGRNLDETRDALVESLQSNTKVTVEKTDFVGPFTGTDLTGQEVYSDGKVYVIQLSE